VDEGKRNGRGWGRKAENRENKKRMGCVTKLIFRVRYDVNGAAPYAFPPPLPEQTPMNDKTTEMVILMHPYL
jgi:hypothetical protein